MTFASGTGEMRAHAGCMADVRRGSSTEAVVDQLRQAASARKCAPCGCARDTVVSIRSASNVPAEVVAVAAELADHLVDVRYECLGCAVCWPAEALGQLTDAGLVDAAPTCPTEPTEPRDGWPPLPGHYTVGRWAAPIAVCTLGDADLAEAIVAAHHPTVSIVGTLATENLGIERLIHNTITNRNIRFVVVAGTETRQRIGHLPGATLLALAANGTDPSGRVIGAPGRRPILTNLPTEEIAHFRATIEVVDLVGCTDPAELLHIAAEAAARTPGPADLIDDLDGGLKATAGYLPAHMTPDAAGYFVIYPDGARRLLRLEHYTTTGLLDRVIEGPTPAHCYTAAIDGGLLTRLDHAAYLGRELTRAQSCLVTGQLFVQDAAPEDTVATSRSTCTSCD